MKEEGRRGAWLDDCLVKKDKQKIQLGRHIDITVHLRRTGCDVTDWTHLAQDWD